MKKSWLLAGALVASAAIAAARSPIRSAAPVEPEWTTKEAQPASAAPLAEPPAEDEQPAPSPLSGEVLETIPAGNYVYLRLASRGGEVWAAVPKASVPLHSTVSLVGATAMHDFESKTLHRTFSLVYFGSLGSGADPSGTSAADNAPAARSLPPGHPAITGTGATNGGELPPGHPAIGSPSVAGPSDPALPPGHPPIN